MSRARGERLTKGDNEVSTASFFAAPNYGGDREPARPKAVNPRTGQEQSWTRASTFASALKNPHGLIKWKLRDLVMGLSQRPDLCRMLLAGTPIEDKVKADEIISQAIGMMAPEAKANEGTAAHTALVRSWVHQDEAPEPEFLPLVTAFARALKEHGLTPKAAEQRVLNLAYNSMGSLDWVFEEANGVFVIGDVKTGKLDEAKREFAVQLAQYDGAEFVVHEDGTVEPIPWPLAHSHAVLVHIDLEHGNAVSVYRVDLNIGRHGAALAEMVRGWAKLDPLTPYVRPVGERAAPIVHHTQESVAGPSFGSQEWRDAAQSRLDNENVRAMTDREFQEHAERQAQLDALPDPTPAPSNSAEPTVTAEHATAAPSASPTESSDSFTEWMKLDKAPLQMELKKRGWTDISHNRRWLARALVVIGQGWTDAAMIKKYAAAKDDWSPEQGYTAPAIGGEIPIDDPAHPSHEQQGPSTATLLEAIAGANNVGAIEALRSDIVERRGDQAWTDELVAAARRRSEELTAPGDTDEERAAILKEIEHAKSQEDLKNLWVRVTIGGSVPENWSDEMTSAGNARLEAIRAATPPPPANPFG